MVSAITPGPTCLAWVRKPSRDPYRCPKPVNVAAGHKWCGPHHQAERKHYLSYKKPSTKLEETPICVDVESVKECRTVETLVDWATSLRERLNLFNVVIRGRRYHHDTFHAGGDSPHLHYITVLNESKRETEIVLLAVNQRHGELDGVTSDPEDLDDDKVAAILGWDSAPPPSDPGAEDLYYTDQFEDERRRERTRLIRQFLAFRKTAQLHGEDTREPFIDYMERLVILAILERSGMRTLLHGGAADVEDFLTQDIVTLDELKQIYVAVHLMTPQQVFSAINDAFRGVHEPHDIVLGRRIYEEESTDEICLAAWDLFEDVMPCRHCALQGCQRLEEWTKIERLATLSLRFLNWQSADVGSFSRADTLFHLSGVFAERKWERFSPPAYWAKKAGLWVQIDRPAGIYLKFSVENSDSYHRFLHVIQGLEIFSVLSWAPAFTEDSDALIRRGPTQLCASRKRTAVEYEDLSTATWVEADTIHERQARDLYKTSRDPGVLHMIVLDRTNGELARLKDNLAFAFLYAEQIGKDAEMMLRTPRAFAAQEMRRLFDGWAAPDWGLAQCGLLGIACGAINVRGETFREFQARCVALVETLADPNLVTCWGTSKEKKQKRRDALQCWQKWKRRLDRMACSKDFFYLGTEEGHAHLREKLGRTISPTDGALVKYDDEISREVFQRSFDRSEAVEKMLPPRTIVLDWDGKIEYPDEINHDTFSFMRQGFIEETMATIVEVQNELPSRVE